MKLEHVALQVQDPVAVAEWYVRHLQFAIIRQGGAPAHGRFLADDTGRMMIEIYNNPKVPVPDYASRDPLLLHVALVSEDIRQDFQTLTAAGASPVEEPYETPEGDWIAMLRDPWGLPLQLCKRA